MKISLFKKGFTLIELLVVIAIIGILTAIVTANFTTAKSKARDAKRVSDIAQLSLVLEQYFDRCNAYPAIVDKERIDANQGCSPIVLGTFVSVIPTDGGVAYGYATNSSNTDYVLRAKLENSIPISVDDVDGTNIFGLDCSDSPSFYYCVQPK